MSLFGKVLLDTNALLHFTLFPEKLSKRVLHFLEMECQKRKGNLYISIISALEIGLLTQKNRLPIKNSQEFWNEVCEKMGLQIVNLTSEVVFKSFLYHKLNSDPFDKIIVASSVIKKINILTSDNAMLSFFAQSPKQFEGSTVFNSRE